MKVPRKRVNALFELKKKNIVNVPQLKQSYVEAQSKRFIRKPEKEF